MHFRAPWGRMLKLSSAGVLFLLVGVATIGGWAMPVTFPAQRLLITLLPIIALAASVPFCIRGYSLQGGDLLVHRLCWDTRWPLHGLKEAFSEPRAAAGSIRVFGNGGMFVFAGLYWNRKLGRFRMLVTDLNRTVVLKLPNVTLVISPENPEAFLAALKGTPAYA
jgi:hypothetical protein